MSITGRIYIALFTSMIFFISLLVVPLPGNGVSYIEDPNLHLQARQMFYWGCSIITFIWLITKSKDNIMGTIMCALFGPVTVLTFGLMWISYKVFPNKKVKKDD